MKNKRSYIFPKKTLLLLSAIMMMFAGNNTLFAAEAANESDSIIKIMLLITIFLIALVMWLTIIYSEKNDNDGKAFKKPFKIFFKWMTKSTPVEEEAKILMDHDFDGIRELDNRVPPWFNILFYGTIVFAIIYMLVFHVFGNGQVQENEYKSEMKQAALEKQILIKTGKLLNVETVTQLTDPASLSEGKEIFIKNCVACHGKNGEGIVGPNLTDDYWIHGGGIKNIFKTITNGVPAKGMISWQSQLAPQKIQEVASYVMSLHGTNPPNAKPPQGTKWEETKTDSTKNI